MGRDQDGLAHAVELDEERQHAHRHVAVEVAGRLVGEDHLGRQDDGPGHGRALALAAGEGAGQGLHPAGQVHPFEQGAKVAGAVGKVDAAHLQRQGDVLDEAQVPEELRVLVHDPDHPAQVGDAVAVGGRDHPAEEAHRAGGRKQVAVAEAQEGALARTGGPDQEMEGPGREGERRLFQDRGGAVAESRSLEFDHQRSPHRAQCL